MTNMTKNSQQDIGSPNGKLTVFKTQEKSKKLASAVSMLQFYSTEATSWSTCLHNAIGCFCCTFPYENVPN